MSGVVRVAVRAVLHIIGEVAVIAVGVAIGTIGACVLAAWWWRDDC